MGYCLYRMGCKGPQTYSNCPAVGWNDGTSWPIGAGHGCVGCMSPNFWDNTVPFYERLPHIEGFGVEATADKAGLVALGALAGGVAIHGVASAIRAKSSPQAPHDASEVTVQAPKK
jgi:hydrogenase small subunit